MVDYQQALEIITNGGVILYPTDTIWGLGGDATNENVIKQIYQLKKRPDSKSLVSLVSDIDMLKTVTVVSVEAEDFIRSSKVPTTIIFSNVSGIHESAQAADGSAAIRLVKDEFCQQLIQALGKPLISTSANVSGNPSPTCFADISSALKAQVDYIAPHRRTEKSNGSASRIVKLIGNQVEVIRH